MSICDELLTVLMDKTPKQELDRDICEGYESANRLFENLLQQKLTVRRGYQLLPIENRICQNTASIVFRCSISSRSERAF